MLPLIVGTLLAVVTLAYVLFPLLYAGAPRRVRARQSAFAAESGEEDAIVALREIEFDRATGKLSDADYGDLKARYTASALAGMRAAAGPGGADDAAEAAVLAYRARIRSCRDCGPRPEPDAAYCSSCGTYLPGACDGCGGVVEEPGAAFCSRCGRQLAA